MGERRHWGWQATADKLAVALVVSAGFHAMALANLAFAPHSGSGAPARSTEPLAVRIVEAPGARALELKPPPSAETTAGARTASSAGVPASEIFYRASEVDERAVPLNEAEFEYPGDALQAGTSGAVTLRLLIGHDGVLRRIEILDSQPPGIFDQAALKSLATLRFRPAMRNGVAVGSVKNIEVPFHPDCNRTGSCLETQPAAANR